MRTFHEFVQHANACYDADATIFKQMIVETKLEIYEANKTN